MVKTLIGGNTMNNNERILIEAVTSYLSSNDLGLEQHKKAHEDTGKLERGVEFLHGHINEMFNLKANDLIHHTGICSAFDKVHNYKYIDDPTFWVALERELKAQAVPKMEQDKAKNILEAVVDELKTFDVTHESDFGYHRDLSDIMSVPE